MCNIVNNAHFAIFLWNRNMVIRSITIYSRNYFITILYVVWYNSYIKKSVFSFEYRLGVCLWSHLYEAKLSCLQTFFHWLFVGFAIKCWVCRSDSDPKCSDPFDNSSVPITDCKEEPELEHLPGVKATMCRKIRQKGDQNIIKQKHHGLLDKLFIIKFFVLFVLFDKWWHYFQWMESGDILEVAHTWENLELKETKGFVWWELAHTTFLWNLVLATAKMAAIQGLT